jgi:GNAT superfamily N-acetyltransferase
VTPALLLEARHRGWWDPFAPAPEQPRPEEGQGEAVIVDLLTLEALDRLALAPRTIPPAEPAAGRAILAAALADAAVRPLIVAAVAGATIVGVAMAAPRSHGHPPAIVALGVAPAYRRRGLGGRLLRAVVDRAGGELDAIVTIAERDAFEPLDRSVRSTVARRLLEHAGFDVETPATLSVIDPGALSARRRLGA